jgi:membrane-associated phospholipid phosphatase
VGNSDIAIDITLSIFLIFGVYQFYFWTQRNCRAPIGLRIRFDDMIPFWPTWTWVYSGLYYPVIIYLNFQMGSVREFTHAATSFIILLFLQMACFLALPVALPDSWRDYDKKKNLTHRFLALVQAYDKPTNCFPSMHTSVAVLSAFYLLPIVGPWAWGFPALIMISCLFTKQHYIVDLPAGVAVAFAARAISQWGLPV